MAIFRRSPESIAYKDFINDQNFGRFAVLSKRYHRLNHGKKAVGQALKSELDLARFSLVASRDMGEVRKGAEIHRSRSFLASMSPVIVVGSVGVAAVKAFFMLVRNTMPNIEEWNKAAESINRNVISPIFGQGAAHLDHAEALLTVSAILIASAVGILNSRFKKQEKRAMLVLEEFKGEEKKHGG